MIFVDVHSHLDLKEYENNLDEVINKCKKNDVKIVITAGLDPESNRKALELSKKYEIIKCSLGIYPPDALCRETGCDVVSKVDEEIDFIKKNKDSVVAIGEVGLDFLDENSERESQIVVFKKMINLAKELEIPLIVHSRKAEKEVLDVLEECNAKKVILHCFSGKKNLIKRASDLKYSFSIPANVIRSEHFQALVKEVNINQLLTETDSPYLSPNKDEVNDPSSVILAVEKIAEIKGFDKEEVANNIFMNYQRLFSK
ncbi:TatD family hydrolase [Candidatus Woesearchaeota archaeon]|nr:TatD family hydrolase [Candidatus Woesearchaeota archaeon]